jgi:branched-chain amino acid transport system substrate-binding protein
MKLKSALTAIALGLVLVSQNATASTVSGPPFELDVISPITGPGAFLGKSYAEAFRAIESVVNATGGIDGRPLKIVTFDAQTNPQVGHQLVDMLVAKRVPVFIDGDPAPVCNATFPVVETTGPVDFCLTPLISPKPGSYVFSGSVAGDVLARITVRYFRERGWTRLAMISSTDASGQYIDTQTDAALTLPENKDVKMVDREHFAPTDVSVAAQIARIKAGNPQALIAAATGTPIATVFRGLKEAGLDVPAEVPSSNLSYTQLHQYTGFLPDQLYFATVLALTPGDAPRGPVRDAQTVYLNAFKAIGVRPDMSDDLAWDPTMIVVSALRKLGTNATATQIRDYIANLRGWAGVDGVYDFRAFPGRGIGENAAEMVRWDPSKDNWVRASLPGGHVAR